MGRWRSCWSRRRDRRPSLGLEETWAVSRKGVSLKICVRLDDNRMSSRSQESTLSRSTSSQNPVFGSMVICRKVAPRLLATPSPSASEIYTSCLERVMNLGENRIEMRIPQSAWFPRYLCFPHS
jgi:hypothetical protein